MPKQEQIETKFSAKRASDEKDHYGKRTITLPESLKGEELQAWATAAKAESEAKGVEFDALACLVEGYVMRHRNDMNRKLGAKWAKKTSAASNADQAETV